MIARSRNIGMLLFRPVKLNAHLLKDLVPIDSGRDVDYCLVNDPLISLKRGRLVQRAQLAVLMGNPIEIQAVPHNGNSVAIPSLNTLLQSYNVATETWEDDGGQIIKVGETNWEDKGGLYAKCA